MKHIPAEDCYIEDNVHYYTLRVYYSDTDAGGIVYHGKYLDFTEHARTELLRCLGTEQSESLQQERVGFVVRSLSIDFLQPAYLDDLLTVGTRVVKCNRFSMVLEQNIRREDELLVSQMIKVGYISLDKGRPVPIPENWRAAFLSMCS